MALLDLIFRDSPQRAVVGVMELDASVSEMHERSAVITRNQVEDAQFVDDHVALEPSRLTVEGLISDSPVTLFSPFFGTAVGAGGQLVNDSGGGFLAGTATAVGLGIGLGSLARIIQKPPRTPDEAFQYLEELYILRQPFEVSTRLKTYQNMVIESLRVPKDARVGRSLRFTATFVEIRIATSEIITVPRFAKVAGVNPNQTVNEGKKATKTLDPSSERSSILRRGVDGITDFFGGN